MSEIDEYILGGYFLAKQAKKFEYMADFMPSNIVSASSCISDLFPEAWSFNSDEKPNQIKRLAKHYEVSVEKILTLLDWVDLNYETHIALGNIFYTVSKAREFANLFYEAKSDLRIIGIGLHKNLVSEYLEYEEKGFGVYETLKQGKNLEGNGKFLGFEVLGDESGFFHSWLCNGLEKDCNEKFGIIPNEFGLIKTLFEAEKCAEYANDDDVGAEPCLWFPWGIFEYEL